MEILKEHKCLNTTEICREVNGFRHDDYQVCHKGNVFGATRNWKDTLCNGANNKCQYPYIEVYRGFANGALDVLFRKGFVKTEKLRFWDKGKALPTDTFRFWFINREDFEKLVLSQTLIPYIAKRGEMKA